MSIIIVRTNREGGRWRAGQHFPKGETEVETDGFSTEQIESIYSDPHLSVLGESSSTNESSSASIAKLDGLTFEQLLEIPGVSKNSARAIIEHFNPSGTTGTNESSSEE
jgi:hypothetical protein